MFAYVLGYGKLERKWGVRGVAAPPVLQLNL
jgi:hypothetical protein